MKLQYRCEVSRYKYVSGGYPCEDWQMLLSVWDGGKQLSLNSLAEAGDPLVVSTAEWLSEMYGDEDDPPTALFTDETWSSVETDEENLEAMTDELGQMGWIVTWSR